MMLVLLVASAMSSASNPNLKIMSFYGMSFEEQKDWLTLAIATPPSPLANQFFGAGIPSIAELPPEKVYKRDDPSVGGSSLLPGWEAFVESWITTTLQASIQNKTTVGVFIGDELCCHRTSCWASTLAPLSAKLKALLGDGMIVYANECGATALGRPSTRSRRA